jgi:peptidyl-tRNA hydrolase, PTH1 family
MRLFVGLGNPGPKYAMNRHNIGYMAVDRIASNHGFAPWRKAFRGQTAEGRLGGDKVLLLKPETFMNLSGESVRAALDFYKLDPADIVVFHDELDLAPGKCRIKQGGGHAGHNGLRSLHAHVGDSYGRVRLGIGHPGHKDRVSGYVLHDFAKADLDWLEDLLSGISDGAPALAAGDAARFQNAVALRTAPPRSSGGKAGDRSPREATADPGGAGDARRDVPKQQAAPDPSLPEKPADERSALRRLVDRFR